MPDQRTLVVLGALLVGMTLTSTVLLALEPGPRAPLSGIELLSSETDARVAPEDRLFDITKPREWKAIVIHDTGFLTGSAESLNRIHERIGRQGLGYHFVVNNGTEQPDGMIEVGFRWSGQLPGAYLEGPNAPQWHEQAIGISLIGDADQRPLTEAQFRELIWLVQQLQQRFGIPAGRVHLDLGSTSPDRAKYFRYAEFRDQLMTPASR